MIEENAVATYFMIMGNLADVGARVRFRKAISHFADE